MANNAFSITGALGNLGKSLVSNIPSAFNTVTSALGLSSPKPATTTTSGVLSGLYNTAKNAVSGLINKPATTTPTKTYPAIPVPAATSSFSNANSTSSMPTPSTPVKSITTPQGVTTTYHAPTPEAKAPVATPAKTTTSVPQNTVTQPVQSQPQVYSGMINQQSQAPVPQQSTPTPAPVPSPYSDTNQATYSGLINTAANRSNEASAEYKAAMEEYNKASNDLAEFKKQTAEQTKGINTSGTWTSRALGEQGQANIQNSATEAAITNRMNAASAVLGAANTQQGLQQGMLSTAIGAKAPVQASPTITGYDPATGKPIYGLGQSIGNGGAANTAAAAAALEQNINQGTTLQGKAVAIDTPMKSIEVLAPQITDFMTKAGINQTTSPWYNGLISDYMAKTGNPTAMTQFANQVTELQGYTRQLLGVSGNITPTEVDSIVNKLSMNNLRPNNFQQVVDTIVQMGEIQKQILQNQSQASYSAGVTPYSGGNANPKSGFSVGEAAPQSIINPTNDIGEMAGLAGSIGLIPSLLGAVTGWAKGLFTK